MGCNYNDDLREVSAMAESKESTDRKLIVEQRKKEKGNTQKIEAEKVKTQETKKGSEETD